MAKKSKVEDESDHIDAELILSIEKLQELQDELEKVNEEASEKVLEIEQEYNEKRRPVYIRRNEILKAIPSFWMTAFLSHPALVDLLSEDDLKIFKYMDSLDVEDFKDVKSGYSITFIFNPNMYFEDTKLTKTFTFLDDGTTKITGTAIKWKDGRDALNGGSQEKKGNKRQHVEESFFSWFSEKQQSDTDYVEGLTDEVAEIIKEDLWPNPLKYFNSEPHEEDSDAGDDNGREEEDNEGEGEGEGEANEDGNE